jgi:predicted branched-subunit amino acid permease
MAACWNTGADTQLLVDARMLMMGMVTARHSKKPSDAHLLIDSYLADSTARDIPTEVAWAMLFSAGVLWVDTLIECRAKHHGQTSQESVQELSLMLVEET